MYASMNVWTQSERVDMEGVWEYNFSRGAKLTTVGGVGMARALCVRGAPARTAVLIAAADLSKYVSADGITIPSEAPGVPGGSGVFMRTVERREMSMSLEGNPPLAMLNYTGTLSSNREGKLAGGTESFKPTRLQTSKNLDKWLKVVSFSIGKDGFLVITDESGTSYRIKAALPFPGATGSIQELPRK
jgi:hypothetical protein